MLSSIVAVSLTAFRIRVSAVSLYIYICINISIYTYICFSEQLTSAAAAVAVRSNYLIKVKLTVRADRKTSFRSIPTIRRCELSLSAEEMLLFISFFSSFFISFQPLFETENESEIFNCRLRRTMWFSLFLFSVSSENKRAAIYCQTRMTLKELKNWSTCVYPVSLFCNQSTISTLKAWNNLFYGILSDYTWLCIGLWACWTRVYPALYQYSVQSTTR